MEIDSKSSFLWALLVSIFTEVLLFAKRKSLSSDFLLD